MNRLVENLHRIKNRIEEAAIRSGRTSEAVKLVAVTKYVDLATTQQLVDAGQLDIGESRPQVLWEKARGISRAETRWHMIGHLQRNKVEKTVPLCNLIHSVDSIRLLKAIDTAAAKHELIASCLLEANISGEMSKHGFQADELEAVLEQADSMKHIQIHGLMGMASLSGDLADNRREFARLRQLKERLSQIETDKIKLTELSMGMSGDFEQAIEEGSTLVRIGSVLFEGL